MSDLKKHVITTLLGLSVGIASTFAFVWRDMAVLKAEVSHLREDVRLITTFIASEDPKAWINAKAKLAEDMKTH